MRKLIKKVWLYRPNAYTTVFTLTATWVDGTSSVYRFVKSNSSWSPDGDHDGKLLVYVPTENVDKFVVRAYEDNPFVSLDASYANAVKSKPTDRVDLRRIVYDRAIDNNANFYRFTNASQIFDGGSVWGLFRDDDLDDVYFSNLTESITLPNKKYTMGMWDGWGLLNETYPGLIYNGDWTPGDGAMLMPISLYVYEMDEGFPVIDKRVIENLVSKPNLDGVFRMLPLYESSGNIRWTLDDKDYRKENE